jgi:hypothetical protein
MRLPLPPGPQKLPLIGNLLDFPQGPKYAGFHRLCRELGASCLILINDSGNLTCTYVMIDTDIIHFGLPGLSLVVLNSHKLAVELLEKRSILYSSR